MIPFGFSYFTLLGVNHQTYMYFGNVVSQAEVVISKRITARLVSFFYSVKLPIPARSWLLSSSHYSRLATHSLSLCQIAGFLGSCFLDKHIISFPPSSPLCLHFSNEGPREVKCLFSLAMLCAQLYLCSCSSTVIACEYSRLTSVPRESPERSVCDLSRKIPY